MQKMTQGAQLQAIRESSLSSIFCICGVFCYLLLSPPLLARFGFNFENDTGNALTKIYPGVYFILFAFLIFLCAEGSPIKKIGIIAVTYPAYTCLFLFYVSVIIYIILRNGPSGTSPIINTHLTVPICAILFSLSHRKYTDFTIKALVFAAILNSCMGLIESAFRFRFFPYDERWTVLRELNFRASAMMGHPLSNALFTTVMIPISMGMRFRPIVKGLVLAVLLLSLIAFGGRAGLGISLLSLVPLTFAFLKDAQKNLTLNKAFIIAAALLVFPVCIFVGVYTAFNSSLGERLQTHNSLDDESAMNRLYSFKVLEIMDTSQLLFGISLKEGSDIIRRLGYGYPVSDIENPWLILFMLFGGIQFVVWLCVTLFSVIRLMRDAPFQIKLGILCYYATASFANSFGRQESVYLLMFVAAICGKKLLNDEAFENRFLKYKYLV